MSRDSSRLGRLGVLAPAALSACMDASVLAVPAAGAIVSTVLRELSKAFMLKKFDFDDGEIEDYDNITELTPPVEQENIRWFHGTMSAKEAEHLMMEKGKNGSFLVRESQARPGEFVLSVRVRGRVSHVMIRRQQDKYDVGSGEQFDDLVGLIEHFRSHPMVEASGDVLRLLQPVSGTRLRAADINHKVQEMQEMEDSSEDKQGFHEEFRSLKMLEDRLAFTTVEGSKPENVAKNRYRNILPYDQTRVVLRSSGSDDGTTSDYINASFVRSPPLHGSHASLGASDESLHNVHYKVLRNQSSCAPLVTKSLSDDALREVNEYISLDKRNGNLHQHFVKDKLYIATQGCLSNTTEDFWRMIWQEDVRVIAMITNEVERGKKKCERYWPLSGHEERYGRLLVKGCGETCHEDYLVRELQVSDDKDCRIIYHYQFMTWPDHGTPESPAGVLALIQDMNARLARLTEARPGSAVCVHCSAGVGRTGTLLALDMLIDQIKASGFRCEIDVYKTVQLVRAQRGGMVQNKAQYRFIYLALQDYIQNHNLKLRRKVYTSEA